jgi:O-acetyl-ADP-ribose deacetylase (regulator of RNase III)
MTAKIEIIMGDITKLMVDAIVNAANNSLLGGGGVDGAIHRAAGPDLLTECEALNGCETGKAKITCGYNLPAKWVIHTVGPIWRGGKNKEDYLLACCYANSMKLAVENNIESLAFPSISTGAYGFPVKRASKIAINEIRKFVSGNEKLKKVVIVCFDAVTYSLYIEAAKDP